MARPEKGGMSREASRRAPTDMATLEEYDLLDGLDTGGDSGLLDDFSVFEQIEQMDGNIPFLVPSVEGLDASKVEDLRRDALAIELDIFDAGYGYGNEGIEEGPRAYEKAKERWLEGRRQALYESDPALDPGGETGREILMEGFRRQAEDLAATGARETGVPFTGEALGAYRAAEREGDLGIANLSEELARQGISGFERGIEYVQEDPLGATIGAAEQIVENVPLVGPAVGYSSYAADMFAIPNSTKGRLIALRDQAYKADKGMPRLDETTLRHMEGDIALIDWAFGQRVIDGDTAFALYQRAAR